MIKKIKKSFIITLILTLSFGSSFVYASTTDGTIDSTYKTALLCLDDSCSTTTRINFKTTNGEAVHITDTGLTGYAWSETFGWINLNPTNAGVDNDAEGNLSGYAWGENAGWINFSPTNGGVVINEDGEFSGYAWVQNFGWIKFDCSVTDACVKTDWRPSSSRGNDSSSGGKVIGSGGSTTTTDDSTTDTETTDYTPSSSDTTPEQSGITDEDDVILPEDVSDTSDTEDITNTDTDTDNSYKNNPKNVLNNTGNILNRILDQIDVYNLDLKIKEIINIGLDAAKTKIGKSVIDIVGTTGALIGVTLSLSTLIFATPISFAEIVFVPLRIWSLILAAFGIKKKSRPWGTVYDSVTKQPLDPAYVVLQDLNGNEVATSITDLDGRYGFLVPAGMYKVIANKTNYEYPSFKLLGKKEDELYRDLYFGDVIEVKEGDVITKNIPMDPVKFDWNEFAKKDQKLMRFYSRKDLFVAKLSNFLFSFGFIITLLSVLIQPKKYNIVILSIYVLLFILRKTIFKKKPSGSVYYAFNSNPLSFAIMRFYSSTNDHEITHKVTDKNGKYYCLIPNGNYYIKVERKNEDGSYTQIYKSENIEVKKGFIDKKIKI